MSHGCVTNVCVARTCEGLSVVQFCDETEDTKQILMNVVRLTHRERVWPGRDIVPTMLGVVIASLPSCDMPTASLRSVFQARVRSNNKETDFRAETIKTIKNAMKMFFLWSFFPNSRRGQRGDSTQILLAGGCFFRFSGHHGAVGSASSPPIVWPITLAIVLCSPFTPLRTRSHHPPL